MQSIETKKKVFITGASSGIGSAIARQLAEQGHSLVLVARRLERLKKLKSQLEKKGATGDIQVAELDVSSLRACQKYFEEANETLKGVDVLINNAGLARGVDPISEGNIADWDVMIDTNVKGLLYVTRLILPMLLKSETPHIVNLGSVSGQWVYPGGGVYCSTKFSVDAITQGLRMDLHGTGCRVTNVCPGLVETEFSEVRLNDKSKADDVYKGYKPLRPEDIAESIAWCMAQPPHVNIQQLTIFPTDQSAIGMVNRS